MGAGDGGEASESPRLSIGKLSAAPRLPSPAMRSSASRPRFAVEEEHPPAEAAVQPSSATSAFAGSSAEKTFSSARHSAEWTSPPGVSDRVVGSPAPRDAAEAVEGPPLQASSPPSDRRSDVDYWHQSVAEVRVLQLEREKVLLQKALEHSERREAAAGERARRAEEATESARMELLACRNAADAAEADLTEARTALQKLLSTEQALSMSNDEFTDRLSSPPASPPRTPPSPEASILQLVDHVASVCEARRIQHHMVEARADARPGCDCSNVSAAMASAAREALAVGTKLWRLQQAQRALSGGSESALGSARATRDNRRPLYALPERRKAGDDIAAQLLSDLSQSLRSLETLASTAASATSPL